MKKMLLVSILFFLTACSIRSVDNKTNANNGNSSFTNSIFNTNKTETTTVTDTYQTASKDEAPSIEEIIFEIEAYFRMFYTNNQDYKWNGMEATEKKLYDRYITGYFDGESLVKMDVETDAEGTYILTTYYFINKNLTYVTSRRNYGFLPPYYTEVNDCFIINDDLWQYNSETGNITEVHDRNGHFFKELDNFEQDKCDILGGRPQSYVKNTFTLPVDNNLFIQFNEVKKKYFRKFFSVNRFDRDISNYSDSNFYALYNNAELFELLVRNYDDTSYTEYVYYPIDDTFIYVDVYYQEFESVGHYTYSTKKSCGWNEEYNDIKKNYHEEFYIVNETVMKYDSDKKDLIESPENAEILTNYYNVTRNVANSNKND